MEVSGWLAEGVLVDFYLALWLDLNGGDAYGMATWDLSDIRRQFPASPWESTSAEFREIGASEAARRSTFAGLQAVHVVRRASR